MESTDELEFVDAMEVVPTDSDEGGAGDETLEQSSLSPSARQRKQSPPPAAKRQKKEKAQAGASHSGNSIGGNGNGDNNDSTATELFGPSVMVNQHEWSLFHPDYLRYASEREAALRKLEESNGALAGEIAKYNDDLRVLRKEYGQIKTKQERLRASGKYIEPPRPLGPNDHQRSLLVPILRALEMDVHLLSDPSWAQRVAPFLSSPSAATAAAPTTASSHAGITLETLDAYIAAVLDRLSDPDAASAEERDAIARSLKDILLPHDSSLSQ